MLSLYALNLDLGHDMTRRLGRLLDEEERRTRDRYVRQELKDRYVAAHGALRLILSSHAGTHPAALSFQRNPFGKPVLLPGFTNRPPPHFNLSHSGAACCIAVSTLGAVGVDVERAQPIADAETLLGSILTQDEHTVAASAVNTGALAVSDVLQLCWTMKEAVLKAAGSGLSIDPKEVALDPDRLRNILSGPREADFAPCKAAITAGASTWTGLVRVYALRDSYASVATGDEGGLAEPRLTVVSETRLTELLATVT